MEREIYDEDHEAFRDVVKEFVKRYASDEKRKQWDAAGEIDRATMLAAGEARIICLSVPEALGGAGVLQDLQAAIDHAAKASGGKVGIIGFCWGGLLTWRAACLLDGLSAAIPYYGGGITAEEEIARQPKCPVMAHFGDQDHWIPMEGIEVFTKAHPEVEVHVYPANHGFNCDQRGSYNEAAAKLARERSLAFFAAKLA